jgi:hypothetical protein
VLHGPPEKAPAAAAALAELVLIEDKTVDVVARESRICVCGHLAHWHSHSGEGDCEHDGDCRCEAFTSSPKLGEAPSR